MKETKTGNICGLIPIPNHQIRRAPPSILINIYDKIGYLILDINDKIGYLGVMFRDIALFVLRISLIVALWAFVWKFIEPKTQLMRILRAALLVLGLLVVLAMLKIMEQ